ncbi:MAG: SUMF1/EgtB/PvdO family nonheme iron enzyme [Treponema sp.]|nr:SUMF1/EgtB/PvdO family nonheme iron enzyme [Treponema sp.]
MNFKKDYTLVPTPASLNKSFKTIFFLILSMFTFSFFSCDGGLFGSSDGIIIRAYDADSWTDGGNRYPGMGRSIFRSPSDSGNEAYTYKISLSRGKQIYTKTVGGGTIVVMDNIPVGPWKITCRAYKSDGTLEYMGSVDVKVVANETTAATVALKKVPENFVFVEGGTFQMGGEGNGPVHSVTVSSFLMCKHEVTWDEYTPWLDTIRDNSFPTYGDKPAHQVCWYYAVDYCNWKSQQEGLTPCYTIDKNTPDPNNKCEYDDMKWTVTCDFTADGYRLPTEAEWEYAARGGNQSHGYLYSGSGDVEAVAVCTANNTSSVMSKTPNELGLYDMSGNLYEWCWDWKGDYPSSPQTNPTGPVSGTYRICRGGFYGCSETSSDYKLSDCRVFARSTYVQCFSEARYGFRVVRSIGD